MKDLTFTDLTTAGAVLLIFLGAYNVLVSAIKNHREEKKRKAQPYAELEEAVKQHEQRLKNDNERLHELENSNRIVLRANKAILGHMVNGNSVDKLSASIQEIDQFLIDRR